MRTRMLTVSMVVAASVLVWTNFAGANDSNDKARVDTLKMSAAALQASNPSLAGSLSAWAQEEANEGQEKEDKKKEIDEATEAQHMKARQTHLQLLKDSAAALAQTHPDLAKNLKDLSDHMQRKMTKDGQEDKDEANEK